MPRDLKKGFECPSCKEFNPFVPWVYAHWNDEIVGECTKCHDKFLFIRGEVIEKLPPLGEIR